MPGDINFKWPLKTRGRGFPDSNRNIQTAVRENLKILLLTGKGQRLMHPNMGTNFMQKYMFEQIDKEEMTISMEREVRQQVEEYMPEIQITSFAVKDFNDDNANIGKNELVISLRYIMTGLGGFADSLTLRFN